MSRDSDRANATPLLRQRDQARRQWHWLLLLGLPLGVAVVALAIMLPLLQPSLASFLSSHLPYSLLGICGAIFANTTGAGGGVVFIPAFSQLQFSDAQAVATSFAIQCFGMTAGAVCWTRHARALRQNSVVKATGWQAFTALVLVCSVASCLGIWSLYTDLAPHSGSLKHNFSLFSVVLGLLLLASLSLRLPIVPARRLLPLDWLALLAISLGGGWLTASLSVGVGELVATYLILRRFEITLAVAVAVCVSAVTVWAALPQHLLFKPEIAWHVVLFAGPGALLGGLLARRIACWLPVRKLKLLFACWVLLTGLLGLLAG
ncbi:TSUP family transporter [Pseudomaricurvus alcaniphilus]|uniref:TSUP family transporter n=1 Tax=Pseudomaricurvus alcaniphilus TaxID=1166482 RepID=UPI00140E6207|nr:TSUP family transporter [Pseudomaricurvus alcaniphilus]NHN37341.1 TSUP family transporter [Pseudomaricurvus alcaniphilus]